jgi:hypothetical protein
MALEATHSDRVVRDDVRQEPSPMDRVGGDEINDVDLSQDKSSIQWRVRKPRKALKTHYICLLDRGREWGRSQDCL